MAVNCKIYGDWNHIAAPCDPLCQIRKSPVNMMRKYCVPNARGRGTQSWHGSHLMSARRLRSKSVVSLLTWCTFMSINVLAMVSRPPFPGGKRPICLQSSNSDSLGCEWSASSSWRSASTSINPKCWHSRQILSSSWSMKPFWCIATPFLLSSWSNSWALSLVIGQYRLQCHTQQSAVPMCKWRSSLGRVWKNLWHALQTASAAKRLMAILLYRAFSVGWTAKAAPFLKHSVHSSQWLTCWSPWLSFSLLPALVHPMLCKISLCLLSWLWSSQMFLTLSMCDAFAFPSVFASCFAKGAKASHTVGSCKPSNSAGTAKSPTWLRIQLILRALWSQDSLPAMW